ncbi:HAMP domain-containing sensor histidine kinase [Lentzea sp. BCCO 10_0061]|uniref:histidine kinase n=1 Tax=Lentzea sokolovensis TaxID=3095429 RepID=A0ABU4UPG4_9PSEU|nr:HAMP domain-containing sensor histidine kinase [Lentzea sp. BCCO 10_0061]MDX8141386.1 HAMP domain-containing sensor histidine kinase [Lentzea sp. BCCO 10_0061]
MKREMTRSLVVATSLVATVLFCAAASLLLWGNARGAAVADRQDVAAVSAVVAAIMDADHVRSAVARTTAGGEGRIAVHLANGETIGSARASRAEVAAVAGGAPVPPSWRMLPGRAIVELTEPAAVPDTETVIELVVLAVAGALVSFAAVHVGRRRFAPVLGDVRTLANAARAGGTRVRATGPGELAELAAAVNEVANRADRLLASEREMIADVSHRLRTPLTALRLDVDVLDDSVVANRIRCAVSTLDQDVDLIIESLRPAGPADPAECDLAAVVRGRMAFWSVRAADQNRWCEVDVPDRPMPVEVAAAVLAAAVDTVLDNVFQHTPEGSPIAVEVVAHAGWITLAVEDGGRGVSAPAEAVRRGRSGGGSTGLGLAIARGAAESTGGSLHVERGKLGGARIRMRFGEAGRTRHDSGPRAWRLWRGAH